MFSPFGDAMFTFIPIFIGVVAIIVFSFIIFIFVKSIRTWNSNNNSPKLKVPAEVVTKRTETSGGSGDSSASTWYYATFQVESGDRMELAVNGPQYGMLADGDVGMLSFQGTRFNGFERVNKAS
ncbi:DUF2500 domain-containing protein [Sporosarcina sp. ANT_H38]|uniref:DUF2500 domain-containing protein n=1 Tax=Sporosarcina sp. ANT_H38 TaxID=2597358 RepID=UPI0011F37D30|nr:DUF2500 domain-containing protein [Sporosarcina sp. ANT_H38]KAA0965453.1 DUF2500 domain-containing protein [Sporosarcina sp. ANT_H38]